MEFKLGYADGLRDVVRKELEESLGAANLAEGKNSFYLPFIQEWIGRVTGLRSVARAYVVVRGDHFHPAYLSNHKSIVGELVDIVLAQGRGPFKTFNLTCAGSDSPEARSIAKYVAETWGLEEGGEADLKLHIAKIAETWEVGAQLTARPLSVRSYRDTDMSGAMDATVAYAMNELAGLEPGDSYLNAFSGSGTLLIEAGLSRPDLARIVGFDNDKKRLSLAIRNIKKAGLITRVELKEGDIHSPPQLGTFDVIAADLPFGMAIAKGEDLERLYSSFLVYCESALNPGGRVAAYTSEYDALQRALQDSAFKAVKQVAVRSVTAVDAYLETRIFICERK